MDGVERPDTARPAVIILGVATTGTLLCILLPGDAEPERGGPGENTFRCGDRGVPGVPDVRDVPSGIPAPPEAGGS